MALSETDEGAGGRLSLLPLECAPEYVTGFPLHVAVTVAASGNGVVFNWLPRADVLETQCAFGLVIAREDGEAAFACDAADLDLDHADLPTFALRDGARRRMLIDLSEVLGEPGSWPPPGQYSLRLDYGGLGARAWSPPARITLREPTREEADALEAWAPLVREARSWGRHAALTPWQGVEIEEATAHLAPLRMTRALRRLRHHPDPLGDRDIQLLGALDGLYAPEAMALGAEVLARLGAEEAFRSAAARVREAHPELAYWMDEIESGESRLVPSRRAAR